MRRQLYRGGGIADLYPRQKYGIGSWVKERIRKLIPNELADVAVKAAPFVAPFNPGIAGLMRGIGRFDQRGSMSDALKQGLLTYGGGQAARYLGGAGFQGNPFTEGGAFRGGGFKSGFSSPFGSETGLRMGDWGGEKAPLTPEDAAKKKLIEDQSIAKTPGFMQTATEATIGKVPLLDQLPPMLQQQLLVFGITGGGKALYDWLVGKEPPQQDNETMEQYMERRRQSVGRQMRTYMDNIYTPLSNPEYAAMSDEEKDAFVARYNVNQGGRVGYQTGGITDLRRIGYQAGGLAKFKKALYAANQVDEATGDRLYGGQIEEMFRQYKANPSTFFFAGDTTQDMYDRFNAVYNAPTISQQDQDLLKYTGSGLLNEAAIAKAENAANIRAATDLFDQSMTSTTQTAPTGEAGAIFTEGANKYRRNADGSRTLIGPIGEGMMPAADTAQVPGAIDTLVASPRTIPTDTGALKVVQRKAVQPEGIQTVPTKRSFNVMMDPKGNVMKDQSMAELARETGIAPDITNYPINSMSDVMRMIGPGTGITEDPGEYGNISMGQSLRENRAINEANRQRNFGMLEQARSRLPGYGPAPIMPMQGSQFTPDSNPDAGLSGQQIAEKYNIPYNRGGRVGYAIGSPEKQMEAGAPPIIYEGNMDPRAQNQQAGLPSIPGPIQMAEDGPEFDMRERGGFQPLGGQEGRDDVPAMLAKNEFVMTADAVRAAGGGSINRGAQRMYDTMKKLESRVA